MEETMRARRYGLVAINAPWTYDADGRLVRFHIMYLVVRCVRAQKYVLRYVVVILFYEERVLHVACGMIDGEVQLRKHVQIVVYLGTVGQHKPHSPEDRNNLVLHNCERMPSAEWYGISRTRKVYIVVSGFYGFCLLFQFVDLVDGDLLQFVDFYAYGFFLFDCHVAEIGHKCIDFALFTKIFQP